MKLTNLRYTQTLALIALFHAQFATAHVMLEDKQAPAGATYTATFRVMHGCDGSPTVRLTVQLPDGISNVEPQSKSGWTTATVKDATGTTQGAIEWLGGKLSGHDDNAFAIKLKLPDTPGKILYFPVVQQCEAGSEAWNQIPRDAADTTKYKLPAPSIRLTPQ